jgi:hypothetical protein
MLRRSNLALEEGVFGEREWGIAGNRHEPVQDTHSNRLDLDFSSAHGAELFRIQHSWWWQQRQV